MNPRGGAGAAQKKRLLFVAYGGGHVNMIIPVVKEFSNDPSVEVNILGLTRAGATLDNESIPYFGFRHLPESKDPIAIEWGEQLALGVEHEAVPRAETIAYLGLSYLDLIHDQGVETARRLYEKQGRQAFLPVRTLQNVMRRLSPDVVIATNSPRAERAAIMAARDFGIPAVCLVDLLALHEIEYIGVEDYADRICVMSQFVKQLFLAAGRKDEEVVVTGNPAFDRLSDPSLPASADRLRSQRGWGSDKVILWASNVEPARHPFSGHKGDPELPRRVDLALFELIKRHPDWRLVIRPHPSEVLQYDSLPERVEISNGEPLPPLLKACDVVVTLASTVGLEAVLLGKPLVSIDLSIFTPDLPYAKMGLSTGVTSLIDLEAGILRALTSKVLTNLELPEVGTSAARITEVIRQLIHFPLTGQS